MHHFWESKASESLTESDPSMSSSSRSSAAKIAHKNHMPLDHCYNSEIAVKDEEEEYFEELVNRKEDIVDSE